FVTERPTANRSALGRLLRPGRGALRRRRLSGSLRGRLGRGRLGCGRRIGCRRAPRRGLRRCLAATRRRSLGRSLTAGAASGRATLHASAGRGAGSGLVGALGHRPGQLVGHGHEPRLAPRGVAAVEDALLRSPVQGADGGVHALFGGLLCIAAEQGPSGLTHVGAHGGAHAAVLDVLALAGADALASRAGVGHGPPRRGISYPAGAADGRLREGVGQPQETLPTIAGVYQPLSGGSRATGALPSAQCSSSPRTPSSISPSRSYAGAPTVGMRSPVSSSSSIGTISSV